jgi:hypothetical protein
MDLINYLRGFSSENPLSFGLLVGLGLAFLEHICTVRKVTVTVKLENGTIIHEERRTIHGDE